MASPEFLVKFAKLVAGADHVARPSDAWDEALPLLCNEIAGQDAYVVALWIADDEQGKDHTLWQQMKSHGRTSEHPVCVSIHAESNSAEALASAIDQNRRCWAGEVGLGWQDLQVFPLIYDNRKEGKDRRIRHLGVISLLIDRPQRPAKEPGSDIGSAIGMFTSWLRFNREARVTRALDDLQEGRDSVRDIATLAKFVCKYMADHGNALRLSALYGPDGDQLKKLDNGDAPFEQAADSILTNFHFGIGPGQRSDGKGEGGDIWLLRFDDEGRQIWSNDNGRTADLRSLTGIGQTRHPVTVLIYRIRDRQSSSEHDRHPPVATLVLVCEPLYRDGRDSIGGAFSQTHRRAIEHGVDFFRYAYALQLQRDKMKVIRNEVAEISAMPSDAMNEESDWKPLRRFAELARNAIPSVIHSAVVCDTKVREPGSRRFYDGDGRPGLRPIWLPEGETLSTSRSETFSALHENEFAFTYLVRKPEKDEPGYWLVLHARTMQPSVVEDHLAKQIAAETAAELNRHLRREQWGLQLTEVRHNLRSVASSVIGKAAKLSERYWTLKRNDAPAQEVKLRLIDQAVFHKAMKDLDFAANELLALTENIRTLAGGSGRSNLQLEPINLPDMLHFCLGLFDEELLQRRLSCDALIGPEPRLQRAMADRHWIHILVFNLIENAVKYSRHGGRIAVNLSQQGNFWTLEVTNEGKYIPPKLSGKIFDPYFRVPAEEDELVVRGTGLGLASVRSIVEMHSIAGLIPPGGRSISVLSEIDREKTVPGLIHAWNRFRVSIPFDLKGGR